MNSSLPRRYSSTKLICLIIFLLFSGCIKPDTWYDLKEVYEPPPTLEKDSETLTSHLPSFPRQVQASLPTVQDGAITLSLEDAVIYALDNNHELQVQRYSPLIAGTFEQVERGVFDPELFAELQYSEETATEVSRSTEEQFSFEADDTDGELGIRQKLPSGTDVELSLDYGRSRSNRTPEQQDFRVGLSITQSLLQGFGPAVNLIDIRQAQLDSQLSLYELRGFLEALISEVEIGYWQYVLASQSINIFE